MCSTPVLTTVSINLTNAFLASAQQPPPADQDLRDVAVSSILELRVIELPCHHQMRELNIFLSDQTLIILDDGPGTVSVGDPEQPAPVTKWT